MNESITQAAEHFKETAFVIAIVLIGLLTLLEVVVVAIIIKVAFVKHVLRAELGHEKAIPAQEGRAQESQKHAPYIDASELKRFEFCERAWSIERKTSVPAVQQGESTASGWRSTGFRIALRTAGVMVLFGFVGLAVGLALWLRQS